MKRFESGGVGQRDEALVEHGVEAIFEARAAGGEIGAPGGEMAELLGLGVGDPVAGQEIGAQQVHQHRGIHPVGLDAGLGDGAGFKRIERNDFAHEGLKQACDGTGVGGGLDGDDGVWA